MAIWFKKDNHPGQEANIYADNTADVTKLAQFAKDNDLKPGSSCLVIGSSSVYTLNSSGQWVQI